MICEAFPTEVPGSYYIKGKKGSNATGKLRNQYLNLRSELAKVGLIQRKSRAHQNDSNQTPAEFIEEDLEDAFELLCSNETDDFVNIQNSWELTEAKRRSSLIEKGANYYFDTFPLLSTAVGHKLVG